MHQYSNESNTTFYDRYLQEVNALTEAGNAFVNAKLIMEGDEEDAAIDETNPRVRVIKAHIQEKSKKKRAMNFLTKLDRNRFRVFWMNWPMISQRERRTTRIVLSTPCNSLKPIDPRVAPLEIW